MTHPALVSENDSEASAPHPDTIRRWTQLYVGAMIVVCYAIFWYGSGLLGIPSEPHFEGSLLQQSNPARTMVGMIAAAVLLSGCAFLADAVLRTRWFLAGLAAACAGLFAWSWRGGPMQQVLFYASSRGVFARLALELILLGAIVAMLWNFFWARGQRQAQLAPVTVVPKPGTAKKSDEQPSMIMALISQTVAMGAILLILLGQTDAKKQVLASVFIAALAGTSMAESYFADRRTARWYWVGPVLVGVIGYLFTGFRISNWEAGNRLMDGVTLAALARPLPLDYASVGMFGALIGYWSSQRDHDVPR